jgi:hypothetical protein
MTGDHDAAKCAAFLQKPFKWERLARTVREVMDAE